MNVFYKFIALTSADRRLLVRVALTVVAVRSGLLFLSFPTVRRVLSNRTRTLRHTEPNTQLIRKVSRSVSAISRYVPGATCLTQAISTVAVLDSLGQPASLRIGVDKTEMGKLQAHAWVESQGKIVIGTLADLSRYTVLSTIDQTAHERDFRNSFC